MVISIEGENNLLVKLKLLLVGLGSAALTMVGTVPAQAASIEMKVLKATDAQTMRCPDTVTMNEQPQPYREGSFAIDGSADLSRIADRLTLASTDDFSVTWVGTLKPAFNRCKATARIVKNGNEAYPGQSYLRLRLTGGKVYLILDMTGMSDANSLTPAILNKGVRNGHAFWSWGGTD